MGPGPARAAVSVVVERDRRRARVPRLGRKPGQLAALAAEGPFGVLGFSQGAMVATAIAALAEHGEFPMPKFAILVAGRAPRADDLRARLEQPFRMPSLHVWGERDKLVLEPAQQLVQHFAPEQREVGRWPGPHAIPTRGEAAETIVSSWQRYAWRELGESGL